MNFLYSSDMNDIKDVKSIYYKLNEDEIILTARIMMFYDNDYHEYRIARYNLKSGYGSMMTKKGTKEYKNLKSLCKATENFGADYTFDYNVVINYYKENKNKAILIKND